MFLGRESRSSLLITSPYYKELLELFCVSQGNEDKCIHKTSLNLKKDPVVKTDFQTTHLLTEQNEINANWLYVMRAPNKE